MLFYLGTHVLKHAKELERSFISVNQLYKRRSDFEANTWIMDSGAFTEISKYGEYRYPVSEYAKAVNRWSNCGNLELAVTQDYMCEPFILNITGLTVRKHQELTIKRYDELVSQSRVHIMPVLQGYKPFEYVEHAKLYGDRLAYGVRVGVGSVCKRNSNPKAIVEVLEAIKKERPDLKLHGFGLKTTALKDAYIESLLYSADSMAWSFHARKNGRNANGLEEALSFYNHINTIKGKKPRQLILAGY